MIPDQTQSKINLLKARIDQLENSELFSPKEKESRLKKLNDELAELEVKEPKEIKVNNPEIL